MDIVFTRGDSFPFRIKLKLSDGSPASKEDISSLYITLKKSTEINFPVLFQKTINDVEIDEGYLHCIIEPEDTENLDYGTYWLDIEITSHGMRKTKLFKVILEDEVTIHKNNEYGIITLEDLIVIPSLEEQIFNHPDSYGYNEVIVKAIETTELNIMPSTETQVKEGVFSKVTVAGDSNLVSENISTGKTIFGVEGNAKTTSAKITNASYLFYYGSRLDYVKELLSLCENVTSTKLMFGYCGNLTTLDLSNFNTSLVTDMSNMFANCGNLTDLDLSNFNTSNVTNMSYMFAYCGGLTDLDLSNFDTSNVTNMSYMFAYCGGLTDLDLSNFDLSNTNNISNIFNTGNIINLKSFKNLGKGYTQKSNNYSRYTLNLSKFTKLTHDSLMSVINNLYDLNLTYNVANGGTLYTQQLVLGSTNLAKLTAEEIAAATNKGWAVS